MSEPTDDPETARLRLELAARDTAIATLQRRLRTRSMVGAGFSKGAKAVFNGLRRPLRWMIHSRRNQAVTADLARLREETLLAPWHVAAVTGPTDADVGPADGPWLTVSVVTHDSAGWLPAFFASLLESDIALDRLELICVDNASKDGTAELLCEWIEREGHRFHTARLIEAPNEGFGTGHDRAIRAGTAPFVLVTNVDLQFDRTSIRRALHTAANDRPEVAAWELRQRPFEHPKYLDPVTWETSWNSHACVLLRRSAYEAAGGYEPRIFMYGEDVELSYRLRRAGHDLRVLPLAAVAHHSYEREGVFKAEQFKGSLAANAWLRARYGRVGEVLGGLALVSSLRPNGDPERDTALVEAKRRMWRNVPHFLTTRASGTRPVPFRAFDYELSREGPFLPVPTPTEPGDGPRVTVITRTVEGRGVLLRQAIASVLNQTWPDIEHLIVEDAGTSAGELVADVARAYGRDVRHIESGRGGRSAAGNTGLLEAKGDFVVFLDDDDLLFHDHIELLVDALTRHGDAAAAYALAWEVASRKGPDGGIVSEGPFRLTANFRGPYGRDRLEHQNFIPMQAIMARRDALLRIGGFHEDLDTLEDWNLWVRLARESHFVHVPKITSLYRVPADRIEARKRRSLFDRAYPGVVLRNRDLSPGPLIDAG